MKVYHVTQVIKQSINIKMMCPYHILKFRNTNAHLLQVYLGAIAKIENDIENHVCSIIGQCYYSFQALS